MRMQILKQVMDADMDALLQMSAWGGKKKRKQKKANDKKTPDNEPNASVMPGLGGSGGTSYNVNHLKKNLVQEMIELSKTELWNDLGDPTIDFSLVEDKIASLVQSNAVVCTTDSNLLDGKWTFAFGSRQSASALMDPNRFDLAARRTSKTLASKSAKVERPFRSSSRTFYLEDMQEDEDAHVLDRTSYFGGLVASRVVLMSRASHETHFSWNRPPSNGFSLERKFDRNTFKMQVSSKWKIYESYMSTMTCVYQHPMIWKRVRFTSTRNLPNGLVKVNE